MIWSFKKTIIYFSKGELLKKMGSLLGSLTSVSGCGGEDDWPIKSKVKKMTEGFNPTDIADCFENHFQKPSNASLAFFWCLLKTKRECMEGIHDSSISGSFTPLVTVLPEQIGTDTKETILDNWKLDKWRSEMTTIMSTEGCTLTFNALRECDCLSAIDGYHLRFYLE